MTDAGASGASLNAQRMSGLDGISATAADLTPGDVRPQLLAENRLAASPSQLLDQWTELGWNALADEILDALSADRPGCARGHRGLGDQRGSLRRSTEDVDCLGGPLARGLFHTPDSTPNLLAGPSSLAITGKPDAHKYLAVMSIHEEIKRRRTALGIGVAELAKRVTAVTPDEPVSRQMVQFWERTTAPKRRHIAAVAQVLNASIDDLLAGSEPISATSSLFARTLAEFLERLPKEKQRAALRECIDLIERLRQQPAEPTPLTKPKPVPPKGPAKPPAQRRAGASPQRTGGNR
jgi:transcriptional regulator with XRE-family HTH domain